MSESVIAEDLRIKGDVFTDGDVELHGTINGDIKCRTLLIAQEATVDGTATAEKIVVRGNVKGTINGVRVTLTSSAHVQGELICKALSVDEEAYFDGTSHRVDDPLKASGEKSKSGNSKPVKDPSGKISHLMTPSNV